MATEAIARRRRRVAAIAACALVAGIGAAANSGIVGGIPPKPRLHNLDIGVATAYVNVDLPAPTPSLAHRRADPPQDLATMVKRAELLGRIMVSPPVLQMTAQRCGVAPDEIAGLGRTTANVPDELTQPDSEHRASDIAASTKPYRVEVEGRPLVPIVDIYAEAPSVGGALCIANAAPKALQRYLSDLARRQGVPQTQVMTITPLGAARGATANGGATVIVAFLTFITLFGLSAAGFYGAARWRRHRRERAEVEPEPDWLPEAEPEPGPEPARVPDTWPHTTRLLPWMLAIFMAVIWLTPFNDIALNVSLPIELRLDRLILPFVFLVWVLALMAGGRFAPRLRMTWIHVALGGLLAVAFVSVVADARYLNRTLELQLAVKKLPLMISYISLFVIAASAVRRSEVRAFLTYTLGLSMIVALGMIWEYRMRTNLFWTWSDKLLPGFFSIDGVVNQLGLDNAGRRIIRGPAEVPLEAVAMLTMALPIALVRLMGTSRWRDRIIYGLAVCAIVAATFATYRKSALIGPVAVILTLAYFRRRELLRLAPLGMVLVVLVTVISPGAIHSTINQFTRSDAGAVPTVSDRSADYDAVRPDVWSHLALGRGWGTYNHQTYRTLDSEILSRTIEAGVIGLAVFLLIAVVVVACSRKTIARRDPVASPVALVGASIAVGFIVLSTLFDELSFPHPVYIFLYMVGFETIMLQRSRRRPAPAPAPVSAIPRPPAPDPAAEAELLAVR